MQKFRKVAVLFGDFRNAEKFFTVVDRLGKIRMLQIRGFCGPILIAFLSERVCVCGFVLLIYFKKNKTVGEGNKECAIKIKKKEEGRKEKKIKIELVLRAMVNRKHAAVFFFKFFSVRKDVML